MSVAFEYPPLTIGTEKFSKNDGKVPNFPGNIKSNNDQSSFRLFCIGEPDKIIRCGVRKHFDTIVIFASGFLIL